ncbi:potassium/proton antiporter [Methylobacterium oxalidis]|uniref:K+/H+ antiporter n=1 Tax=Methylobacterium oxalidis TaxID=944322 RepID=A0A512JDI1_9HYPH|nr:potassium/proton antiporter [Methylobacterium oxalidis]GEP08013.1 K+/H+ antiporter [Methylobacterium oxalidis]GJE35949.1 K(+)/H(+) antiporter NhaP [Methylobacterium oxalidis]GLS67315.1 K+/H+ antiporter [Methylobacterium oxalidis]
MSSIADANLAILLFAIVAVGSMMSGVLAARLGAPVLIAFLAAGMLAGRQGPGGFAFADYRTAYLIGSLALAVILFDGGLRTKTAAVRRGLWPGLTLATIGVLLTAAVVGATARLALGLPWPSALLVGATISSTDAAAVFFLLRAHGLRVGHRVEATLEVESAANDPLAVFLTLTLVEFVAHPGTVLGAAAVLHLAREAALGTAFGIAGGLATSWALNRVPLPAGLNPLFALSCGLLVFGGASVAGGSGFLAVYLAGLVVGNRPVPGVVRVLNVHEALTWLAQLSMLVVLGILVTPSRLIEQAGPSLIVALALIFVARPLAVLVCLAPFRFTRPQRVFVSAMGLRGAVGIFLASIPVLENVPQAALYFDVAFFVVLTSLLLQGWTAGPIARWLGLAILGHTEPRRVDLGAPVRMAEELVGFPVQPSAPILTGAALPDGVRLAFVLRDNRICSASELRDSDGVLAAGDQAYVVAPPSTLPALDVLFSTPGSARVLTAAQERDVHSSAEVARLRSALRAFRPRVSKNSQ